MSLSRSPKRCAKTKRSYTGRVRGGGYFHGILYLRYFLNRHLFFFLLFYYFRNLAIIFELFRFCTPPPSHHLATALSPARGRRPGWRKPLRYRKKPAGRGKSWVPRSAFRAGLVRRKRAVKQNVGRTRRVRPCKRVFVSLPMRSPILYAARVVSVRIGYSVRLGNARGVNVGDDTTATFGYFRPGRTVKLALIRRLARTRRSV